MDAAGGTQRALHVDRAVSEQGDSFGAIDHALTVIADRRRVHEITTRFAS